MLNLSINGTSLQVKSGTTVMQAADAYGYEIPRFCYHPRLAVAGNCRICVVEVLGFPKPLIACATPVSPNISVIVDTPQTLKVRESVMELILYNHPLDCPVCEQGGECDLQDQAMKFGLPLSRNLDGKKSSSDKSLSPVMWAVMTRCINCTRCVRYANQVAGDQVLGITGRGGAAEIGTYDGSYLSTHLTGDLVDLCPVGALTTKLPGVDVKLRSWTTVTTARHDPFDPLHTPIALKESGGIFRAYPLLDSSLGDKSRYGWTDVSFPTFSYPLQASFTHPLMGSMIDKADVEFRSRMYTAFVDCLLPNFGSYSVNCVDSSYPDYTVSSIHDNINDISIEGSSLVAQFTTLLSSSPLPFKHGKVLPLGGVAEAHVGHVRRYAGHSLDISYGTPDIDCEHFSGASPEGSAKQSWSQFGAIVGGMGINILGERCSFSDEVHQGLLAHISVGSSSSALASFIGLERGSIFLDSIQRLLTEVYWASGTSVLRTSPLMLSLSHRSPVLIPL